MRSLPFPIDRASRSNLTSPSPSLSFVRRTRKLSGKRRRGHNTNNSLQKTDAYRQITRRIVLQPDKATTIMTLTRRAQLVCNTPDSLSDENKYPRLVFDKSNYNYDFIRRNAYRPTETTQLLLLQ